MEIIIFIAVVVGAALLWNGYVKAKKADSDDAIDNWKPASSDQPWPYGEKLSEGKIHVKTTDVSGSENRVEATAPAVEPAPGEKAPAKKPAAKTPTKRASAKKSST